MAKLPANAISLDLFDQPGHLIRRAQQIAVSMFYEATGPGTTPIQYAILRMLQERPGIDQVTLAHLIALDNSTTAETARRLEDKGLIVRELMARRQRSLFLTPEGEHLLSSLVPAVHRMRHAMLESLEPDEQQDFMRLLSKFVHLYNDQSRSPGAVASTPAPASAALASTAPDDLPAAPAAKMPARKRTAKPGPVSTESSPADSTTGSKTSRATGSKPRSTDRSNARSTNTRSTTSRDT